MINLNTDVLLYTIYAVVLAIAADIALILAWRRYNRNRRRPPSAANPAASLEPSSGSGKSDEFAPIPIVEDDQSQLPAAMEDQETNEGPAEESALPPTSSQSPTSADFKRPSAQAADPFLLEESLPENEKPTMAEPQSAPETPPASAKPTAHVQVTVDLPVGETVRVTIESTGEGNQPVILQTDRMKPGGELRAASGDFRPGLPGSETAAAGTLRKIPAPAGSLRSSLDNFFRKCEAAVRSVTAAFWNSAKTSGRSLFYLALIIYLASRLIGLTKWPIYFFTDEAVQTNFAAELVKNDFVWHNGEALPTFFENAGQYEMNFSVYVQVLPYLLFGKSEFVTRGVSVLVTLLGMAAVGLILQKAFRLPQWWSGVLILSIIPAWFLDSRTAFESAEAVALYAVSIYFYLRYRTDHVKFLFPALFFGALAAYTYSPAQMIVLVTGVLLFFSDIRYHWKHKVAALLGLLFLAVLSLPYIRYLIEHPTANRDQLAIVGSPWLRDISLTAKLNIYFTEFLKAFDPRYWFLANPPEGIYHDIIRHLMPGYGHIALWTLPFVVVGLLLCLINLRSSPFRTVLIALLAAPTGAALAQITVTRALFFVFPIALLTALGISWLLTLFERREEETPEFLGVWKDRVARFLAAVVALPRSLKERTDVRGIRSLWKNWREQIRNDIPRFAGIARVPRLALSLGLFIVLAAINIYMLWDALTNGPTWYSEYELYGMQYGGEQVSTALKEYHQENPETNLIVSTSWANGTDEIFRFFLPENFPFRTGTVDEFRQNVLPLSDQDLFVMTPEEYERAVSSDRFTDVRVEKTLPYPDGTPGFYFVRLRYVANIEEIIAAEKAELAKPVEEDLVLRTGETVHVIHSRFDMGSLTEGFNDDWGKLMRSQTANPLFLELFFPELHRFTSIRVRVGGGPTRVTAYFYPEGGDEPKVYSVEVQRSSDFRDVVITLPEPTESGHLRLEIETVGEGEPNHVHVYGIDLEGVGWTSRP